MKTARKRYVSARTRLYLEFAGTWNASARSISTATRSLFGGISNLSRLLASVLTFAAAVSDLCGEALARNEKPEQLSLGVERV